MNILNFRIIISLVLILMLCVSLLTFYLRKNIILKMIDLAVVYIIMMVFLLYLIIIKGIEEILFSILIIIFINLIVTFVTGIMILKSLLKSNAENYYD